MCRLAAENVPPGGSLPRNPKAPKHDEPPGGYA